MCLPSVKRLFRGNKDFVGPQDMAMQGNQDPWRLLLSTGPPAPSFSPGCQGYLGSFFLRLRSALPGKSLSGAQALPAS